MTPKPLEFYDLRDFLTKLREEHHKKGLRLSTHYVAAQICKKYGVWYEDRGPEPKKNKKFDG